MLRHRKNKRLIAYVSLFSMLIGATAQAHEMWLEPLRFSVKPNAKIFVHEKVGRNFKGNTYSYLDSNFKKLELTQNNKTKPVNSRLGDNPAINETVTEEGLLVFSALSTGTELTYETKEKFENFLKAEKLDWVFDAHKKRGLPEKGFTEIFRRNAKSLVKVGHGKGEDKALGLPLEWVIKTNPYTTKSAITACLYWQGKPLANKPIHVFNNVPVSTEGDSSAIEKKYELIRSNFTTDKNACVNVPRNRGIFMINAVKMIEPSKSVVEKTGAVWESVWSSITYSTDE